MCIESGHFRCVQLNHSPNTNQMSEHSQRSVWVTWDMVLNYIESHNCLLTQLLTPSNICSYKTQKLLQAVNTDLDSNPFLSEVVQACVSETVSDDDTKHPVRTVSWIIKIIKFFLVFAFNVTCAQCRWFICIIKGRFYLHWV